MSVVSSNEYFEYFGRFSVAFLTYPLEYVKCLIQLGYEPLPGKHSHTFFGTPCMRLPGLFDYVKIIKEKNGYFGLYTGLSFKIASQMTSGIVYNKLQEFSFFQVQPTRSDDEETESTHDSESIALFSKKLALEGISRTISIVVSHPFHVICVRKIAQFIGGENTYDGLMSPFFVIYQEEGLKGFFKGLTARIVADLVTIGFSSVLAYIVNEYILKEKTQRSYSQAIIIYGVSSFTYPLTLVSNIMCVNNTKMALRSLPHIPVYTSSMDCFSNLRATNNLHRGSSVIFRKRKIDLSKSPFMPAIQKQFYN